LPVGPADPVFHLEWFARRQVRAPRVLEQRKVFGMNDAGAGSAPHALMRKAGIILPGPVDEIVGAVVPIAHDHGRDHVDRRLQLPFSLAGLLFGRFAFGILEQQLIVERLEILDRVLQLIPCAAE
jgi:hypothetical protein